MTKGRRKNKNILRSVLLFLFLCLTLWNNVADGADLSSNTDQAQTTATETILTADAIPTYTGADGIEINGGKSTFTDEEMAYAGSGWVNYGNLDDLNRVTTMDAMVTPDMYRTGSDAISSVLPTGWSKSNQNESNPKQLNRGHLLADVLGGSGEDWRNLVTLYRNANYPTMYFAAEDIVSEAIQAGTAVRYRVTPLFKGEELMCDGLHIMAKSVNDDTVDLNVYVFNEPEDGLE